MMAQNPAIMESLKNSPVVPVIRVSSVDRAVALAKILVEAGLRTLEVTLRTDAACDAIQAIASEVPGALVGAGTVLNQADLDRVSQAGAHFAVSPGATPALYDAAMQAHCVLIPGVATSSELMLGMEHGYSLFKFFPAKAAGGVDMIKAWAGPFPSARFMPTGGITPANARDYLNLANVIAIGGSWMVPDDAVEAADWIRIKGLAEACRPLFDSE